ncbi:MAG: GNAT family N-acetyltransferase [Clostridia bacterium]|nr:GNAT family N-acetyltransferase [Clostridia bacterium]
MNIRKAELRDLNEIMAIYERARRFMTEHGNPRQWAARSWPPEALIRADIAAKKSYVCEENGQLAAVFYYDYGPDIEPTYRQIEEGSWGDPAPYGVVHRIASAGNTHGAGAYCIDWAYAQSGHLRIDTHGDNLPMQRLLEKLGFTRRGIIHVAEDHDPRLAYEK